MARRPNYGFEKRQKELDRQKKKDAKAERKEARKQERALGGDESDPPGQADADLPVDPSSPE